MNVNSCGLPLLSTEHRERQELEYEERCRRRDAERRARERQARAPQLDTSPQPDWAAVYAAIDARIEQHFLSGEAGVGGVLKDVIAAVIAHERRARREEVKVAIEEVETRLVERLKLAAGRLPVAKIWCPETVSYEAQLVSHDGGLWQACKDTAQAPGGSDWICVARAGRDAGPREAIGKVIELEREGQREEIKEAIAKFEAKLAAVEDRLKSSPGKLPVAKTWSPESVVYKAEFVTCDGSLYQAIKDTAQAPGGSDWICVAAAGRDGRDACEPRLRGAFDAYEKYQRLDIISYEDTVYIARRDNPGLPFDDGWQILSKSGSRGPAGDRGERGQRGSRGPRGVDAATIVSWVVDPVHYRLHPVLSNGKRGSADRAAYAAAAVFERSPRWSCRPSG